jgi:hypothetical protein
MMRVEMSCIMKPNTPTPIMPKKQILSDSLNSSMSGFLESFRTFAIERRESERVIWYHLPISIRAKGRKIRFNLKLSTKNTGYDWGTGFCQKGEGAPVSRAYVVEGDI